MKFISKQFWLAFALCMLSAFPLTAQFTSDANGTSYSSGNVGVGQASNSSRKLYVYTNNDIFGLDVRNYYNTSGNKYGLYSLVTGGTGSNYGVYSQVSGTNSWAGYFRGRGYFQNDVGIGTVSPSEKLAVDGNIHMTGNLVGKETGTSNSALTVAANTWGGNGPAITLYSDNDSYSHGQLTLVAGHGNGQGRGVRFLDYNGTNWDENMAILNDGKVGIGTACVPTDFRLGVKGAIICEEIKVQMTDQYGCWPDYVFDSAYDLRSLSEVESYIQEYKHLPDVPGASEVASEGINLGEMNAVLLRKIEELTLYVIELEKRMTSSEQEMSQH